MNQEKFISKQQDQRQDREEFIEKLDRIAQT